MRDIIITMITILLIVLTIFCMVRGIKIAKIEIPSFEQIKNESKKLDTEIEAINKMKKVQYKFKIDELEKTTKELIKNKEEYLELASISSDKEILKANIDQIYAMEFLWNKIGRYATKENLTLKWKVDSTGVTNRYNLKFEISGNYVSIINYIYAIENDSDLAFRIENFSINSDGENVKATFTVSNIGIKEETVTSTPTENQNNNSNNEMKPEMNNPEMNDIETNKKDSKKEGEN